MSKYQNQLKYLFICFFCRMPDLKEKLLKKCFEAVDERIKSAENAIISAKEASQDDTKSSAGDKYETTREMMQQEISRNEAQLYEAKKLKHSLLQIQSNVPIGWQCKTFLFRDGPRKTPLLPDCV